MLLRDDLPPALLPAIRTRRCDATRGGIRFQNIL